MGLFSPSNTEVEQIRNTLDDYKSAVERLEREVDSLKGRVKTSQADAEEARALSEAIARAFNTLESDASLSRLPPREKSEGSVITLEEPVKAWKATERCIVKLRLPKGAKVVYPRNSTKFRTDEATVIGMFDGDASTNGRCSLPSSEDELEPARLVDDISKHRPDFEYHLGETMTPDRLDEDIDRACTNGIHIFATVSNAAAWY